MESVGHKESMASPQQIGSSRAGAWSQGYQNMFQPVDVYVVLGVLYRLMNFWDLRLIHEVKVANCAANGTN